MKEIRGADNIPIGEIKEHDTKSFPVAAGYSVHEDPPHREGPGNQGHKGLVFDDAPPYNTRNYEGYSLDEYIKSVTNPGLRQATTAEPKPLLSDVKSLLRGDDSYKQSFGERSKTKTTKYVADFDNAFILPDDKVPSYLGLGSNIEIVKAPKIGKKNRKQAEYLKDYNIKDIQIEHERQLDELESFTKRKPGTSTTDFNFGEIVPYGKAKPVSKPTTTKPPSYNFKVSPKPTQSKYKSQQSLQPLQGQASYNSGKYFEQNPKSPRLSDFIQASEDEKLETAVREALAHLRKSQRARGRANGAATKLNPVKQPPGPGGPPGGPGGPGGRGPRRPRRPFNNGPSPVRVFNFNN